YLTKPVRQSHLYDALLGVLLHDPDAARRLNMPLGESSEPEPEPKEPRETERREGDRRRAHRRADDHRAPRPPVLIVEDNAVN
ncbi:hypothetical protein, partial [Aquabacterium sp.]|uniref:hypothetical protein n=1 Tax=Aquabacterium sp. TaxID=1872578 RepID=UPI0035C73DD0